MTDQPRRLTPDSRRPQSLDECFALIAEHAPEGWQLLELCFLPDDGTHGIAAHWYASAGPPGDPITECDEGTGATPVRALLTVARRLHARKHRVGRPSKPYVPPPLPRRRDTEHGYRSLDMATPVAVDSRAF